LKMQQILLRSQFQGIRFDPTNAGNIGNTFAIKLYEKNGNCIGTAYATLTA
jgi:hypothetical protein